VVVKAEVISNRTTSCGSRGASVRREMEKGMASSPPWGRSTYRWGGVGPVVGPMAGDSSVWRSQRRTPGGANLLNRGMPGGCHVGTPVV
jgi:hypothetical protein